MLTYVVFAFTVNIPADTHTYRAQLPRIGVIKRIILRTDATPPKMVILLLNNSVSPIRVSWEALRLLRLHTAWQHEPHARLLYEDGDLLDLKLDPKVFTDINVEYHDASGLQEITVASVTTLGL